MDHKTAREPQMERFTNCGDDWIASAKLAGKIARAGNSAAGARADGGGGLSVQASVRGYVLAGGASSRFGTDKALAEFQGQTMLARTAKLLSTAISNVKIVSPTAKLPDAAY